MPQDVDSEGIPKGLQTKINTMSFGLRRITVSSTSRNKIVLGWTLRVIAGNVVRPSVAVLHTTLIVASVDMDFLSQTYIALRGPTGAPQSPVDTIAKLSDRLSPSTLLADRRAAVLSLKGLARDCKAQVGETALPGLIHVLQNDAEIDADTGKAVLETIHHLCEVDDASRELGLRHTDYFLADEQATHTLFTLLADAHFYVRYGTLQLLATLLQNRRSLVQGYFLKAPNGAPSIISVLEDKREIIRNGQSSALYERTS